MGNRFFEWRSSPTPTSSERRFYVLSEFFRHGSVDRVSLSLFAFSFLGRDKQLLVLQDARKRKSRSLNTRTLSTLGNARYSVFHGRALRPRNYPKSSDTMWTTVRLRQGGGGLFRCHEPENEAFTFSKPQQKQLKAYLGGRCCTHLGAVHVWVTFLPYTGYVQSTMAFF